MQEYPHHYTVAATVQSEGHVLLESAALTPIESAPPPEFGGPEGYWSPETLLVSAVADCFVLSFKAIARASSMNWISLHCEVEGVLDRVERISQFTDFNLRVTLEVPAGTDEEKAARLLEKAENACLITNSLKSATHLNAIVTIAK